MQDLKKKSITFYYYISTTYQKIGDLFCPDHISGLLHSVCAMVATFASKDWSFRIFAKKKEFKTINTLTPL